MNWADYSILAIVITSILVGLLRGFTREIFGLGTWVLAVVVAVVWGAELAQALQRWIATPLIRLGVAYGGLFLGGLLIGGVLTGVIVSRVRESRFSSADRTLGSGLGLVRGVLLVGLILLLGRTAGASDEPWWRQSVLIGPSQPVADGLDVLVPDAWLAPLKPDPAVPITPASELAPASVAPALAPH